MPRQKSKSRESSALEPALKPSSESGGGSFGGNAARVSPNNRLAAMIAAFGAGVAVTMLFGAMVWPTSTSGSVSLSKLDVASKSSASGNTEPDPQLWRVLSMSDAELSKVDLGYLNLLCSSGLPGSNPTDLETCRKKLDDWTRSIQLHTENNLYKFRKNPSEYEGREGFYRMLMLISVLQQDLGVQYNKDRIRQVDFRRSQDLFIHGMILGGQEGGTCVSMPALYTTIARRLGYPVKLVLAKAHVFCRWDDGKDRFNIEAAGVGMSSHPDSYYQTWPLPLTDGDLTRGTYLRSLSPREELSVFMDARGHCLRDNGYKSAAAIAYAHAYHLDPMLPENLGFLQEVVGNQIDPKVLAAQQARERSRQADIDYEHSERRRQFLEEQRQREYDRVQRMNRSRDSHDFSQLNPFNPSIPDSFTGGVPSTADFSQPSFQPSNPQPPSPFPR